MKKIYPFMEIDALIKLRSLSYDILKRAVTYVLVGDMLKANIIKFADIYEDTRFNLFVPLQSGYGKGDIISPARWLFKQLNERSCAVPTSLHSEQLVGKRVMTKKGFKNNYGHLHSNMLIINEGLTFLTNPKFEEGRAYVSTALDPIYSNRIEKQNVDNPESEKLEYYPTCTLMMFFQPQVIPEETVTRGLLRRGMIVYISVPESERDKALGDRLQDEHEREADWGGTLNMLKTLLYEEHELRKIEWEYPQDVRDLFFTYTKELVNIGNKRGKKSRNFTKIMKFVLQNYLIKMSTIQAAIHGKNKIAEEHVTIAFRDLKDFWNTHLDFVTQKVKGNFDYLTDTEIDNRYLPYLDALNKLTKSADKKKEKLTIKEYLNVMCSATGKKLPTVRKRYYKLRDMGLLESKQIGKRGSEIRITDKGIENMKLLEDIS